MIPISVCMIAKNEEQNIENCLKTLIPHGFEIIVVDTGSTDRTKEIALNYTTKVYDFEWVNDFSAARNYSASLASNQWILMIDCDEYITNIDVKEIVALTQEFPKYVGQLVIENAMISGTAENTYITKLVRLYSRNYYHFEGTIHEQVCPFQAQELFCFDIPLTLYHTGYIGSKEKIAAKNKRNIDLLLHALEQSPEDPYHYFQLGQSYVLNDDYSSACDWFSKGLSFDLDPSLEYVQTMVVSYGQSLLKVNRYAEALAFTSIYDDFSYTVDFVYLMGRIYYFNEMPLKALAEFIKALSMPDGKITGTNSFLPSYYIAVIYDQMNNMEIATIYYKKCGEYPPAQHRLIELGLAEY